MAKGVEDTAFYRWFRLTSLNEVGGDPEHFGVTPEEFHAFAARLNQHWPKTMTTLSTHDTKRSEDVRARLGVLSEQPAAWSEAVREWRRLSEDHRSPVLDGSTEYLFWQTLFGTWDDGPLAEDRLQAYLLKAIREAKRHTTWTSPDEEYEQAVAAFATRGPEPTTPCWSRYGASPHGRPSSSGRRRSARSSSSSRCPAYRMSTRARSWSTCPWWTRTTGGRWTTSTGSTGCAGWTTAPSRTTCPTRSCSSPRGRCAFAGSTRRPSPAATPRSRPPTVTRSPSPVATRSSRWRPDCPRHCTASAAGATARWCCRVASGRTC